MTKILVIHGAGMNMRGKVQTEVFGTMTMPEYDVKIKEYAAKLEIDAEIFHSNIEGEVINRIYEAHEDGVDAALINPAGYSSGNPTLVAAISQVRYPTYEVHISNPASRGGSSDVSRACKGVITGFGIYGYYIAMMGALNSMNE